MRKGGGEAGEDKKSSFGKEEIFSSRKRVTRVSLSTRELRACEWGESIIIEKKETGRGAQIYAFPSHTPPTLFPLFSLPPPLIDSTLS